MRAELGAELARCMTDWLDMKTNRKQGAVVLTPYDADPRLTEAGFRLIHADGTRHPVKTLHEPSTPARTGCS